MDLIKVIKKQSEKQLAELHDLTDKLSLRLKDLITLIPQKTRGKSVEAFLNDIRKGVFGDEEAAPRKRRGRRAAGKKRVYKTRTAKRGRKRGRKKAEAQIAAEKE